MATINLTEDIVYEITCSVERIYNAERNKIEYPHKPISGDYGDTFAEWLLPKDKMEALTNATPSWMKQYTSRYTVRISTTSDNAHYSPWMLLDCSAPVLDLHNKRDNYSTFTVSTPGINAIDNVSTGFIIHLSDGGDSLPKSDLRDSIIDLNKYIEANGRITTEYIEAVDTMRKFLKQHRTLQSAMKEFGPSLSFYVPAWLMEEYNRVPPKRTRKPKSEQPEKAPVKVDGLIAKATVSKLNI